MNIRSSYGLEDFTAGSIEAPVVIRHVRKITPLVAELRRRHEFRADLKRLLKVGSYMIDDIGLTHKEALRESEKPFWKP
jgi:uncharacterized protein YjiS (DUF1127 family)